MTLLALLTDRLGPGVWRADEEPDRVEWLAAGLGWTVRRFVVHPDKDRLIAAVAEAAGAPAYVRANWDSLADGLKDIEPPAGGRLLLVAEASGTVHDAMLIGILDEAATFLARFGVIVQTLWIGPGEAPRLSAVDPLRPSRLGRTARTERTPDR